MNTLIEKLNSEQKKAVLQKDGYILVLAGAGSGKTRVLTTRIANLLAEGVSPYNILAITFTNKASKEMKERLDLILGENVQVWTSTFHSFCAKILRMEIERLGFTRNFSIYTEMESERLLKKILKTHPAIDPKSIGVLRWHISRAKNAGMLPSEYLEETKNDFSESQDVYTIYGCYQNELKNANALDFDDLLMKTVELFEQCPDVLQKYQHRFQYINVDEFQDTNYLQFSLVEMLSAEHKNLFVVGDEDQSIYSWRGAIIENILDFPKLFKNATVYKLEQNYRSTPEILSSANRVIAHNLMRNEKKLWTDAEKGKPITYFEAYNEKEEAEFVVRKIRRMTDEEHNFKDFAVLVRANSLTRVFEENFNMYGIPYKIFGGFKFFERKEIKDFLAYLRLAVNPHDNEAFLRAVSVPKRGLGEVAMNQLLNLTDSQHSDLYSALSLVSSSPMSSATKNKFLLFKEIVDFMVDNSATMDAENFSKKVLEVSGLRSVLSQGNDEDKTRLENMEELCSAIANFKTDNKDATIEDFLQSVALVADTDEMDDGNYVTIATVHAVKGLEFDNVFIVGLEDGIFPTKRSIDACDIEEERRLMYVAITRARKNLTSTWARGRFRFGHTEYMPVSRFINEMKGEKANTPTVNKAEDKEQVFEMRFGQGKSSSTNSATSSFKKEPVSTRPEIMEEISKFKVGSIVEHKKYGKGVVVECMGEGNNKMCSINFAGLGIKKFVLAIAIGSLKLAE